MFLLYLKQKMELSEVYKRFNTQNKCIRYLESKRWGSKPTCPYCGSSRHSIRKNEFRYNCNRCRRSYSVLIGTLFESTKLPLTKWFVAITLILNAKKGISSLQLGRDIGVNRKTAWYLQKRIRTAMEDNDTILSGIVEVDETYLGGSISNKHYFTKLKSGKYHKTGMEHKLPVLGMAERNGKVILKVLKKAWGKEIQPIMKTKITSNSTIVTDGFGGYYNLKESFNNHIILNHTKYKRKEGIYHTNTIEGIWTTIKRAIMGQYHKLSMEHAQSYLNEITFKYNYGHRNEAFNLLINNLLKT